MTSPYPIWQYLNMVGPYNQPIIPPASLPHVNPYHGTYPIALVPQHNQVVNLNYHRFQRHLMQEYARAAGAHEHPIVDNVIYQNYVDGPHGVKNEPKIQQEKSLECGEVSDRSYKNKDIDKCATPPLSDQSAADKKSLKRSLFTIDAILAKDKTGKDVSGQQSPYNIYLPNSPSSAHANEKHELARCRSITPPCSPHTQDPLTPHQSHLCTPQPLMHSTPLPRPEPSLISDLRHSNHLHHHLQQQAYSYSTRHHPQEQRLQLNQQQDSLNLHQNYHYFHQHQNQEDHSHVNHHGVASKLCPQNDSAEPSPPCSASCNSSASISMSSISTPDSSSSSNGSSTSSLSTEKQSRKSSGKTKRVRTIFTPDQLERLEAEFERQQYMVGTERFYLASSLNLTEAQVKVWFQNRRIKWRKHHLEQQQARLARGDLYRDLASLDDAEDEEQEEEYQHGTDMDEEENISASQMDTSV